MGAFSLRVVSVNVWQTRILGEPNGEEILSAIDKCRVQSETIEVGKINLAEDAQANLEKHGGPDKAIYAYPTHNWPWWEKEHQFFLPPGGIRREPDPCRWRRDDHPHWRPLFMARCRA
jgi:MOSC domain-containing protein YiiM